LIDRAALRHGHAQEPRPFYRLGIYGVFSDFPDTTVAARLILRGLVL